MKKLEAETGEILSYQVFVVLSKQRLREFNSYSDSLILQGIWTPLKVQIAESKGLPNSLDRIACGT